MSLMLLLGGCQIVTALLGDSKKTVADAEGLLKAGDLAGAATKYEEGLKKSPTNADLATGAAYTRMLAGDTSGADAALAAAEAASKDPAQQSQLRLRRALVAIQSGDLDKARGPAEASGLAVGKLLAAEIDLANGNRDQARTLLQGVAETSNTGEAGAIGQTATAYLSLLNDANPLVSGLSETQALWALGQQKVAVRSVEDLVKAYAETREDGNDQLLIWAGRAAAVGEAQVAYNLLDAITVPPPGQAWRVPATRAIATCAEGKGPECVGLFAELRNLAPGDGFLDASVTAALVVADKDPASARALVDGLSGDGVARVLVAVGDKAGAARAATDPALKAQLGG